MSSSRLYVIVAVVAVISVAARADIINVPADQPTIQAAIDVAIDGDTIIVDDGVYTGAGNKNLVPNDRSLTLRSANGPAGCVIDCENDGRAFFLLNEAGTIVIEGLTVTRGRVDVASPGGRKGGGLFCVRSSATVVNCIFDANHAHTGGGIFVEGPDAVLTFINCRITNQVFTGEGGGEDIHVGAGVLVRQSALADFVNCTIANNISAPGPDHLGGGVHVNRDAGVLLANCVLWGNVATFGAQIGVKLQGIVTVRHCDVQGGEAEVGIPDGDGTVIWGDGNVDADPLFVDDAGGDFRIGAASPGIDAAHNGFIAGRAETDLGGRPRFADGPAGDTGCGLAAVVDMGSYEFQGVPSDPVRLGDIDGDGIVGVLDFLGLVAAWGACVDACCLADLDLDGEVGIDDFLILLASWG
jgi:hypothetical protein